MVKHYLEHIFPNGFKAQVVCHSKLAAVRYQKAIHQALKKVDELESADVPDHTLINRIKFSETGRDIQ